MGLVRRSPRVSQPQGSLSVDRTLQGLKSIYLASGGILVDASGTYGSPTSSSFPSRTVGRGGVGFNFDGAANFFRMPAASLASGTTFSKFAVVVSNNVALIGTISSTAATSGAQFRFNGANLSFLHSGNAEILSVPHGIVAGQLAVVGATHDGSVLRLFVNGREIGSVANTTNFGEAGSEIAIGQRGAGSEFWSGQVYLNVEFTKAVSQQQAIAITANPWSLFAPEPRRLFVPAAAGGGTTITCTVGDASAAGVSNLVNITLQAGVASASAVGVSALLSTTVQASVGASAAAGVTARLNTSVAASVGSASSTGVNAQLATTVSAGPGNATATGVNAVIAAAGNTTIACSVGAASAAGVSARLNTTLQTGVGAAGAQGVLARLNVTLQTGVGEASAIGVSFSSGGGVYIPALLQFTSPARGQAFTSPGRAQSFTSPGRAQSFTSPSRA